MKLNDFKDVMDNCFGDKHENISDKEDNNCKFKEVDRNTIIITALSNYYDYNPLSKEEGREVIKIIQDIQADNRLHNFLTDDLKKLETNVNKLIENVYASGKEEQFADDIEDIDNFFSYWEQHLLNEKGLLTKTK